jgi:hypothetical protein
MFKNITLFGNLNEIMFVSNISEIINNLCRAAIIYLFKFVHNNTIYIINIFASAGFVVTLLMFIYAIYRDYNFNICAIAWILNRILNSITASCRDSALYRMNLLYRININIPMIKTIKSLGNIIHLLKIFFLSFSYYSLSIVYFHFLLCTICGFINIAVCIFLYFLNIKLLENAQIKNIETTKDIDKVESMYHIVITCIQLILITIVINIAQVDDSIVYYKVLDSNMAFILKQCVGQIVLGMLYSLIFGNSVFILILAPLVNIIFHQLCLLNYNYLAAVVIGLQFMVKNSIYVLLSMILCKYNPAYPAICIIADAIGIGVSNLLFLYLNSHFDMRYSHYIFRNLGLFSFIFSILLVAHKYRDKITTKYRHLLQRILPY